MRRDCPMLLVSDCGAVLVHTWMDAGNHSCSISACSGLCHAVVQSWICRALLAFQPRRASSSPMLPQQGPYNLPAGYTTFKYKMRATTKESAMVLYIIQMHLD